MMKALKHRAVSTAALVTLTATGVMAPLTSASADPVQHNSSSEARRPVIMNGKIVFGGGVPVGGWYSLSLYENGSYQWSGHAHDSGGTSYNFSSGCVVRMNSGTTYAFKTSGRLHGTFESGSRDHDWSRSGKLSSVPAAWAASRGGWTARCNSRASLDINGLINSLKEGIGYVTTIVAIVA